MLELIRLRLCQINEHWRAGCLRAGLQHKFCSVEEAVPVRKDLSALKHLACLKSLADVRIIDITPLNHTNQELTIALKSRHLSSCIYIKRGFLGFGVISRGQIIGDIWYVTGKSGSDRQPHPQLKQFGITLGPEDVYLFDMYMTPSERGKSLTTYFMGSVLAELHQRGHKQAYGYYLKTNLPALWVHRILGYEELPHYRIRRLGLWESSRPVTTS